MHWFTLCDLFKDKTVLWLLFSGTPTTQFFSVYFLNKNVSRKASQLEEKNNVLVFQTFDPSQCQQQNKNPQHLDAFRSFWVVCARNSRTERNHTHSLSYTLHIFTPYICWIPLMKHECWDRVDASLKPVKGQIVDVQESRTLVRCFFRQNHVSLYCVVVLNSKDDLLAIAWPPGHASQIFMRPQTAWRQKHVTYSHNLSYMYDCCSSSSVLPFALLVEPWSHNTERMHHLEHNK